MKTIGNFSYLSQIRSANRQIGNHWFDPNTLRFFKGKVYEGVYGMIASARPTEKQSGSAVP